MIDPMTSYEQHESEQMERQDDWAEDQHQTSLEVHAKELWQSKTLRKDGSPTGILERLERLIKHARKVEEKGVAEGYEADYQMDLLLTEWGCGKLMAYFGALAETEGQ